jgi:hypothetical protein
MDGLSQYTGSNGAPGHGQYIRTDFVPGLSPNVNNPTNWIQINGPASNPDQPIQSMLQNEMNNGRIDAADGNKLYMVFLPPGVGVADGSKGGHHDSFTTNSGARSYYAIIDHPLSRFSSNLPTVLTSFQQLTLVASHEMVEAISDPMINYRTAWKDRNPSTDPLSNDEIGDITQAQPPAGGWMAFDNGYVVQKYWSELAQTSVALGGIDFQPLQSVSNTFPLTGINFTLYSEQNGQYVSIPVELTGLLSTNGSNSYTYQVLWGAGKDPVEATLSVDGLHNELQILIYDPEYSTTLFNGVIMAPENNWQQGDLEMSGYLYQSNGVYYAYGNQIPLPAPTATSGNYGGGGGGSYSPPRYPRVALA